jgi:hypothetical protein
MALADNIVSYWKLEDLTDSVGSNTLTNNNTVTFSAGKISNGANFARASSQSLSRADNASLSLTADLTASFWLYLSSSPSSGEVYGLFAKADSYKMFYQNASGTLKFTIETKAAGSTYTDINYTLATSTWYHVVWTKSGTTNTIYVNGVSIGTGSASATMNDNANAFYLGFEATTGYLNGSLDEFALWSRAITADEASQIFNSNRGNQYPFTATPSLYGGVTYYKLDESSGNAADSIGTATLTNNNTTTFATGKINNAAIFNGSNQSLSSGTVSLTTNAWSIGIWVNPDDADMTNQCFFSYRPGSGAVNIIQAEGRSDRTLRIQVYASNGSSLKDYRTSLALTQSAWNYVFFTWNGTDLLIYVNGTLDTSVTKTVDNAVTQTLTARAIRLGAETAASNFFDGNVDEVSIFNRVLSDTERGRLYNNGLGLQYPFPDTSGFLAFFL